MNRPVKYRRIYDRQGRPGIEIDPIDANKAWKEQQEIDARLATLNPEQRIYVDGLRDQVLEYFITSVTSFYKHHPELRINWHFSLDGEIREE